MKELGPIFKSIRESRKISLEKATGGEFSRSMLSRFENGQNDLSTQRFMTALNNIHISLHEFERIAGLAERGFVAKTLKKIRQELSPETLEVLYQKQLTYYQKTQVTEDYLAAIIIRAHLVTFSSFDAEIGLLDVSDELTFLHDYLFSIDVWYSNEIALFAATSPLFSSQIYRNYTEELVARPDFTSLMTYNRDTMLTILLNGFLLCIAYRDFENTNYFNQLIQDSYFKENETYKRIVYLYAKGELQYHLGKKEEGAKEMQQAIDILRILDCHQSADYYQLALDEVLENN